jgi:hypothetical protein
LDHGQVDDAAGLELQARWQRSGHWPVVGEVESAARALQQGSQRLEHAAGQVQVAEVLAVAPDEPWCLPGRQAQLLALVELRVVQRGQVLDRGQQPRWQAGLGHPTLSASGDSASTSGSASSSETGNRVGVVSGNRASAAASGHGRPRRPRSCWFSLRRRSSSHRASRSSRRRSFAEPGGLSRVPPTSARSPFGAVISRRCLVVAIQTPMVRGGVAGSAARRRQNGQPAGRAGRSHSARPIRSPSPARRAGNWAWRCG